CVWVGWERGDFLCMNTIPSSLEARQISHHGMWCSGITLAWFVKIAGSNPPSAQHFCTVPGRMGTQWGNHGGSMGTARGDVRGQHGDILGDIMGAHLRGHHGDIMGTSWGHY